MAELLIRVRDRVHATDAALDEEQPKRGFVVVVQPDGWPWSALELTRPFWRIIKLPGVAVSAVEKWVESEAWTAADLLLPEESRPVLGRRVRKLNLDAALLPAAWKTYLADDTRASPSRTVNTGGAFLDALEQQVTPLRDRLRARLGR